MTTYLPKSYAVAEVKADAKSFEQDFLNSQEELLKNPELILAKIEYYEKSRSVLMNQIEKAQAELNLALEEHDKKFGAEENNIKMIKLGGYGMSVGVLVGMIPASTIPHMIDTSITSNLLTRSYAYSMLAVMAFSASLFAGLTLLASHPSEGLRLNRNQTVQFQTKLSAYKTSLVQLDKLLPQMKQMLQTQASINKLK